MCSTRTKATQEHRHARRRRPILPRTTERWNRKIYARINIKSREHRVRQAQTRAHTQRTAASAATVAAVDDVDDVGVST